MYTIYCNCLIIGLSILLISLILDGISELSKERLLILPRAITSLNKEVRLKLSTLKVVPLLFLIHPFSFSIKHLNIRCFFIPFYRSKYPYTIANNINTYLIIYYIIVLLILRRLYSMYSVYKLPWVLLSNLMPVKNLKLFKL